MNGFLLGRGTSFCRKWLLATLYWLLTSFAIFALQAYDPICKLYQTIWCGLALDKLNMTVESESIFGFLGPNGSGKTTILRMLTGLAKPTAGSAHVAGVYVSKAAHDLPAHIGYLPEEPAFYSWKTPQEFLDYIGRLHGLSSSKRSARIKELLLQKIAEIDAQRSSRVFRC